MILTRAELLSYTGSLKTITQLARAELTDDLAKIVSSTTDADAIHAALDTLTPALIQKYGKAAGSASTQLWNYIYEHDTGAYGNAVVYMNTYEEYAKAMAIDSNYAFSEGDDTDTDKATSFVADTMIHNILGSARSTMTQNSVYSAAHGTTTKYARVPQGAYTCAFCLMLASRGFVYASEESAGEFDQYHKECVLGDTMVSGPELKLALRRQYEGTVIDITTATGRKLSVTPNHPILTGSGWKSAGDVCVGDYLVCADGLHGEETGVPDDEKAEVRISDLFERPHVAVSSARGSMPTSAEYLDSKTSNKDVDVVGSDRILPGVLNSAFVKPPKHSPLRRTWRLLAAVSKSLNGSRPCDQLRARPLGPSYGFVGSSGLGKSLGVTHLGRSHESSGRTTTGFDAMLQQNTADYASSDMESVGDRKFAGPADIFVDNPGLCFDAVDSIVKRNFSGQVYNLHTTGHWFSANGIITHNCDCMVVPSFSDDSAVEGYNPDELYAMYHSARENASSTSTTDILHEMRAQYGVK